MVLVISAAVLAVLLLLLAFALPRRLRRNRRSPFVARRQLLDAAQYRLLNRLEQDLGEEYRVFSKVSVAEVVTVRDHLDRTRDTAAWDQIAEEHFDFVLCAAANSQIVGVIAQDDGADDRRERRTRLAMATDVCRGAGLPLIRLSAGRDEAIDALRHRVLDALGGPIMPELGPVVGAEPRPEPTLVSDQHDRERPACPNCGAVMLEQQVGGKRRAGRSYWRCSQYPACRGILPIDRRQAEPRL